MGASYNSTNKEQLTPFGKFIRKIRLDRDILLKDMAFVLDVSPSYLSRIENGGRNVPLKWSDMITSNYDLSQEESNQLHQRIIESRTYNQLNISHLSYEDNQLVYQLVKVLPRLDKNQRQMLDRIIESSK